MFAENLIMKTKEIAHGALMAAIYALLLLVNQQFSLFLETSLSWVFVFPILIYTAMYTAYAGFLVMISMALITLFFGGITTIFYSWTALLTGYVCGLGILYKWDSTIRIALCFLMNLVSNFCVMLVWAGIFDIDYQEDMQVLQTLAPWLSLSAYIIMLVILMSLLQTICIHMCTILICSRLRISLPKIKPVTQIVPNRWLWILSLILWLGVMFLFNSNMVECSKGLENFMIILLFLDFTVLDYYGAVHVFRLAVIKRKRWLAGSSVLGALIPGLNIYWAALGFADSLRQFGRPKNQGDSK